MSFMNSRLILSRLGLFHYSSSFYTASLLGPTREGIHSELFNNMQYHFLTFFIWLFIFIANTNSLQLSEIPKSRSGRIRLFSNSNLNVSVESKNSRLSGSWRHIQVVNGTDPNTSRINYAKYEPTWESLDARPLPKWFDESKIGIFIHWGVFSVPSFGSEWFWHFWKTGRKPYVDFMEKNYPPHFTYQDFGPQFTAEFFDPNRWAEIFSKSGAKYVVLTSKHHEGFTLWPSKSSFGWNAVDIGPKRDIVGQLASAIRNTTNLKFGLYHSLFEWYNPLYLADLENNFTTNDFVNLKTMRELYEIVNEYQPEVLWSDGDGGSSYEYWQSREFLAWLYNDSPVKSTVVTNDRWGTGTACKHGGYFTCNDRYNPGVLQPHKWENCMTLDKNSWGYRRNGKLSEYLTPEELISTVVETVSCGGNILINVGPTKEGIISPLMEERLLQLGTWLEVNGEAIYGSLAWTAQNDTITPTVWYTQNPAARKVYAFLLKWPSSFEVQLGSIDASIVNNITLLGYSNVPLRWKRAHDKGVRVKLPSQIPTQLKWGWTLIIQS